MRTATFFVISQRLVGIP